jgi:hypothetical protein
LLCDAGVTGLKILGIRSLPGRQSASAARMFPQRVIHTALIPQLREYVLSIK